MASDKVPPHGNYLSAFRIILVFQQSRYPALLFFYKATSLLTFPNYCSIADLLHGTYPLFTGMPDA
jgi:hypothetical protein